MTKQELNINNFKSGDLIVVEGEEGYQKAQVVRIEKDNGDVIIDAFSLYPFGESFFTFSNNPERGLSPFSKIKCLVDAY